MRPRPRPRLRPRLPSLLRALCALAALTAAACHDLPDLGTCGNGIVEEANGEACDDRGESPTCTATCELSCLGEGGAASYVAVGTDAQGSPVFCPDASYQCGTDGICRAPSGAFEPIASPLPFDVGGAPVLGDVDNDGLLDLVGTSATKIYIRFASTAGAPLGDLVVQEAPFSDAPYVIFDPDPSTRDPMRSDLRIGVPTEGLALLRSDDERFAPELELPIEVMVTGQARGLVVRDPDPSLGDVVVAVQLASPSSSILVGRVGVPRPGQSSDPVVPPAQLPACAGAGPSNQPWRLVDVEAVGDRRSFVVISQRDATPQAAQPWHVCRYTQVGGAWSVAELDFAAPAPTTAVLANLDGDACLELAVHGEGAAFSLVDATTPDCGFAQPLLSLPVRGGGARILGAGQVLPGDNRDELVLDNGVFQACAGESCGTSPPGTFVSVATPTKAQGTWSAAALSDLNHDGALDVVAARGSEADVDIVRGGTSSNTPPNVYRASTSAPIDDLVAGDFDGDRLGDVAMVEATPLGERIVVLFGTLEAVVGTPRPMTAVLGESDLRLDRFSQIRWIPSTLGTDGIDDLFVLDLRRNPSAQNPAAAGFLVGDSARLMTTPRFPEGAVASRPLTAVAAGPFADVRGGVEVLALAGDRALIYNVLGNAWAGQGIPIPPTTPLDHPIATLRDGPGQARAVARGAGNDVVVFSVRGMFSSCKAAAAGAPLELRGVDIDGDGIDEVAVLYAGDAGLRSLQMFRVEDSSTGCKLAPVLADVLDGCVDVASAGERLIAICRIPGEVGPGADAARGVFTIARAGGSFIRSGAPIARVQGDGRSLTAGDYDGDGVLDLAIAVHRVDEVGVQLLRQCPAHDTRTCRPAP